MNRRKFLTIAGLGGALAAITSFKFVSTSFEEAAADIIKNELSFLKLDEEGLKKFISEFSKKNNSSSYRYSIKGYSFLGISSNRSGKINQLVSTYLLSTDFFLNKMDETRTVKYVGLYDPYLRPCANPFSHHYFPQHAA